MWDIQSEVKRLLNGCIIESSSGVRMYTPDGVARYGSLWTRDFTYMVQYARDLIPDEDIENGLQYLIDGIREDGWVPDRVEQDGTPRYTAGGYDYPASPNLDNGPFLCLLADLYLGGIEPAKAQLLFLKWKDALCKGLDCLPQDENSVIINFANPPHSPYGFTDTVCKTGKLCFETLLMWQAKRVMVSLLGKYGFDADKYANDCANIERCFADTFSSDNGMLFAATETCCQTDIWASCYAISIGFPLKESQKKAIADWLIMHAEEITQAGQIRHLPAGEYWEKTFVPVEPGTYQNGAFWGTATGWFCDAVEPYDRNLAVDTVKAAVTYFKKYGFFECVNGEYRQLDTYVATATNVYAMCQRYLKEE